MRYVFVLLLGVGIGYFAGFSDAKKHDENALTRTVNNFTGKHKGEVSNDLDAKADSATTETH